MEQMEIARQLEQRFPDEILEIYEYQRQVGILVRRQRIIEICRYLKETPELRLDHLMCLCGVDNLKRPDNENLLRFEVVYNLYSVGHRHSIKLRAQIPEETPEIDSVTPVWCGADWPERECYDLMGIRFKGHPDIRRILLPDTWEGHPLRKEYPLRGETEWPEFDALRQKVLELKKYDFHPGDGDQDGPCSKGDRQ